MSDITKDKITETLEAIAEDMQNDARNFDGQPFNGKTVAEYFGNHGAAIAALANIIKTLLPDKGGGKIMTNTNNNTGLRGADARFHGGCSGCTNHLRICPSCQFMEGNWNLPNRNPVNIARAKEKQSWINRAYKEVNNDNV